MENENPRPSERTKGLTMKGVSVRRSDGSMGIKHPSFENLSKLEAERRKILKRLELPAWRILTYTSGTCLKGLVLDPLIWITMAIYVGIRIAAHVSNRQVEVEIMGKSEIGVLGAFLSFFLVFFVNQTNGRFLEMYGFSKGCSGRTQDIAGLAMTQFPEELALQIIRHMNAAHVAGYVGMGGPYSKTHFFNHYNNKYNLLTQDEMKQIAHVDMNSGSDVMKELITWCQHDVATGKKAGYIDSYEANEMHSRLLEFRATMDTMYDYCDQPPHFFYIHFLVLLSAFYLPIFAVDNAYSAGWGADSDIFVEILNGVIVFCQCIFVIGLRLLGQKMVNPYGDDMEDLSVKTYLDVTFHICGIITTTRGSCLLEKEKKLEE